MAPMLDFELMAKLTLGKKVWKKLSKAKRAEFTKLYVKRMENSYSSKVDAYTDEQVVIRKIQRNKKNRITLCFNFLAGLDSKTRAKSSQDRFWGALGRSSDAPRRQEPSQTPFWRTLG